MSASATAGAGSPQDADMVDTLGGDPPAPDLAVIERFAADVIGEAIHLVAIGADGQPLPHGRNFGNDAIAAASWAVDHNVTGCGIYWTVNKVRPGVHKKPTKADILAARFLHVDIDLPFDQADVLARLAAHEFPPSFIIHSGGGLQALWRLGYLAENANAIESLNRRLASLYGGDHCHNIDRLLRVPGTVNYPNRLKRSKGRVPALADIVTADNGRTVDPEEIYHVLPVLPAGGDLGRRQVEIAGIAPLAPADLDITTMNRLLPMITVPNNPDRSAATFAVACEMVRQGFADIAIGGVLINPALAISGHCLDQASPLRAIRRVIGQARASVPAGSDAPPLASPVSGPMGEWPDPEPLPDSLPPVSAFDPELLPSELRAWVVDIAKRMNCPLEFVAIPAMVAAGSLIGRRVGIRPEMKTDWTEVANLWGCVVGPPGSLKSPAVREALAPIRGLEARAAETYAAQLTEHKTEQALHKLAKEDAEARARGELKKLNKAAALSALADVAEPDPPRCIRYMTTDATVEKLGEICAANPDGILVHRDELLTMFSDLDREEKAPARGFFMTGWGGLDGYTFDRIMRGTVRVPAVNISLFGTTQPGRVSAYIRESLKSRDDGMVQRLQLLAWPDVTGQWQEADTHPDSAARSAAYACFERLASLDAEAVGAEIEAFAPEHFVPFLRFAPDALDEFRHWRADLEAKVRADDIAPAFSAHLAKFRGLVPRLALIIHLTSGGTGPVSLAACAAALTWAEYLEAHARRAYGSLGTDDAVTARAIWRRIIKGDVADGFTSRDVYRKQWSGLADKDRVEAGIALLADCDWLRRETPATGGRPTTIWHINPKARA